MVLTVGSAVVHASPWESKLLVYVGDNSQCITETYSSLDAWVCWSLVELLFGHYLDVDPWGQPMNSYWFQLWLAICTRASVQRYWGLE